MISITMRLIILLLLVSLVTPDSVTQYVQDTRDLSVTVTDAEDTSPIYKVMTRAGRMLEMTRDLVEAEAKTVLVWDNETILFGIQLASLTFLGLSILGPAFLIIPILIVIYTQYFIWTVTG